MPTEFRINGTPQVLEVDPNRSLLSVLRNDLDMTGTKYGCGEGQCGCCTVLIDGNPSRSCITGVGTCEGKNVSTIEGLANGDTLHPLQEAFIEEDAMQCGYCTAGMIMSAAGLLERTPEPETSEILRSMEGNVCRCGTYARIVLAIQLASRIGDDGGSTL